MVAYMHSSAGLLCPLTVYKIIVSLQVLYSCSGKFKHVNMLVQYAPSLEPVHVCCSCEMNPNFHAHGLPEGRTEEHLHELCSTSDVLQLTCLDVMFPNPGKIFRCFH